MFTKKTGFVRSSNAKGFPSQGGHIVEVWMTPDGSEYVAVGYILGPDYGNWFVGRDYRPDEGYWNGGIYEFPDIEHARRYVRRKYGRKVREVLYPIPEYGGRRYRD